MHTKPIFDFWKFVFDESDNGHTNFLDFNLLNTLIKKLQSVIVTNNSFIVYQINPFWNSKLWLAKESSLFGIISNS